MSVLRLLCLAVGISVSLLGSSVLAADSAGISDVMDPGEGAATSVGGFSSYAVEEDLGESTVVTGGSSTGGSGGSAALLSTAALRMAETAHRAPRSAPGPAGLVVGVAALGLYLSDNRGPQIDPGTEAERELTRYQFAIERERQRELEQTGLYAGEPLTEVAGYIFPTNPYAPGTEPYWQWDQQNRQLVGGSDPCDAAQERASGVCEYEGFKAF